MWRRPEAKGPCRSRRGVGYSVAFRAAEHGMDQRGHAQGQQEVGLRLSGLPDGIKLGVFELDQPLPGLHQFGQVGLTGLEQPIQRRRLPCPTPWRARPTRSPARSRRSTWRRPRGPGRRRAAELAGRPPSPAGARPRAGAPSGLPLFQTGSGADEDEPDVLHARLVHLVLRTDDGRRDSVPFRQADGGVSAIDLSIGGVDVGAALQCLLNHHLLVDRWNIWRKGKLAKRLDRTGLFGDSDLVAQVGQGREIILPGRLDQLPALPGSRRVPARRRPPGPGWPPSASGAILRGGR